MTGSFLFCFSSVRERKVLKCILYTYFICFVLLNNDQTDEAERADLKQEARLYRIFFCFIGKAGCIKKYFIILLTGQTKIFTNTRTKKFKANSFLNIANSKEAR
jgi:hypothetical protein